ncbi:hypothetical protein BDZ45DRAFT_678853 [Acephala macrosclerotiorum]|nr:hypothetical protein BDZ45DRAFT_678853 [Acephala macrosclerotiorum]
MCYYERVMHSCGDHEYGDFKAHCDQLKATHPPIVCNKRLLRGTTSRPSTCPDCQYIAWRTRIIQYWGRQARFWQKRGNHTLVKQHLDRIVELKNSLSEYGAGRERRQILLFKHDPEIGALRLYSQEKLDELCEEVVPLSVAMRCLEDLKQECNEIMDFDREEA